MDGNAIRWQPRSGNKVHRLADRVAHQGVAGYIGVAQSIVTAWKM